MVIHYVILTWTANDVQNLCKVSRFWVGTVEEVDGMK
jgi:hypothetical protein